MIAALTIPLTLIVLYVLYARRATGAARTAILQRDSAVDQTEAVIRMLDLIATRPDPAPLDLSALHLTDEIVHALNERMDTINRDMAVLTTRVETGPGKRTLRVP